MIKLVLGLLVGICVGYQLERSYYQRHLRGWYRLPAYNPGIHYGESSGVVHYNVQTHAEE